MLSQIALYTVFGVPLVVYGGILTLLSFLVTATIGFLAFTGKWKHSFKWHPAMAAISILLALVHMVLGLSIFFGF